MTEYASKVFYSGCDHDPEATSKGFCWQCRIAELEARVEPLQPFKKRILALEARLDAVEKVFAEAEDEDWVRKDWLEEALEKTDE